MRNIKLIYFLLLSVILFVSCKKEEEEKTLSVTTVSITSISETDAFSGGSITVTGGANATQKGVCWSTTQNPTITDNKTNDGEGTAAYTSHITGLVSNTTYFVRAYATNNGGTEYGNQLSFKTASKCPSTITDGSGNIYEVVQIDQQCWMTSNLKTTKYNNGNDIPNLTDNAQWSSTTNGAYCNYENNTANAEVYGKLYNWYAVETGNLCPQGWHVATDSNWILLAEYLGGNNMAGGKLKEIGTSHWMSPNSSATDEYGFSALPGGMRYDQGDFYNIQYVGYWWTSTNNYSTKAWMRSMNYNQSNITKSSNEKNYGHSVRCVKD